MSIFLKCAASAVAVSTLGTAAIAGPYANIEANSGFVGSDYVATVTDIHVGYEGALTTQSDWYIQGGPAIVSIDGYDQETELSGKVGINVSVTDKLGVYGEFAFLTDGNEDANYGSKAGVKYSF